MTSGNANASYVPHWTRTPTPAVRSSVPAPNSPWVSCSGAPAVELRRASTCARLSTALRNWERGCGRSAHGWSCAQAGKWLGDVTQAPGTNSQHRSSRSCTSWPRASATERWQPSCSSARARSTFTCATCSGSSISAPASSSPVSISTVQVRRPWRPGTRRFRRLDPRHPSYGRCRGVSVPPTGAVSERCQAVGTPTPECATVASSLRCPIGLLHGPCLAGHSCKQRERSSAPRGGLKHRRPSSGPASSAATAGAGDVGSLAEERDRRQKGNPLHSLRVARTC